MNERFGLRGEAREFARRVYHPVRKRLRAVRNWALFTKLRFQNRFSHRPVTGSGAAVVSLTSYGERALVCAYTIESIARGSVRPHRIILWLDEEELLSALPASLTRLVARGLEIRSTENYGPHKKYYPAVAEPVTTDLPLVTADDDTIYPRSWLSGLLAAHGETPHDVVCYRAWVVQVRDGVIEPYGRWLHCRSTVASPRHFATGCSGVLYPPELQAVFAGEGTRFMDVTPRADDIWLHWLALRSGFAVRQIGRMPLDFPTIPGTNASALLWENVHESGNDKVISQLYDQRDIALLGARG